MQIYFKVIALFSIGAKGRLSKKQSTAPKAAGH